jgi:hypothetical protein
MCRSTARFRLAVPRPAGSAMVHPMRLLGSDGLMEQSERQREKEPGIPCREAIISFHNLANPLQRVLPVEADDCLAVSGPFSGRGTLQRAGFAFRIRERNRRWGSRRAEHSAWWGRPGGRYCTVLGRDHGRGAGSALSRLGSQRNGESGGRRTGATGLQWGCRCGAPMARKTRVLIGHSAPRPVSERGWLMPRQAFSGNPRQRGTGVTQAGPPKRKRQEVPCRPPVDTLQRACSCKAASTF